MIGSHWVIAASHTTTVGGMTGNIFHAENRRKIIYIVKKIVLEKSGLEEKDLRTKNREDGITFVRQEIQYLLAEKYLKKAISHHGRGDILREIADATYRDKTVIYNSTTAVLNRVDTSDYYQNHIEEMKRKIDNEILNYTKQAMKTVKLLDVNYDL